MGKKLVVYLLTSMAFTGAAYGQRPVTLEEAVQSAITIGPRVALVRADSVAAAARLLTARAYPNPLLSPSWTQSPPQYHFEVEQPIDLPFARAARIRAASLGARGASLLAEAERTSIRYEVEVAYANAAAGVMIRTLSHRNAADARELLRITREREKAGDASDLDVKLADVSTGQAEMQALADSLQSIQATLDLQLLMGLAVDRVAVIPVDSLDLRFAGAPLPAATPLRVAIAEQQVQVEQANLALARASRIPTPAVRVGVEWHDPQATDPNKKLPLIGLAIPFPLWDRNRGPIEEAKAAQARANAELSLVRLQTGNALLLAQQQRAVAQSRAQSGRAMVDHARRVAALSLTAYREGAYSLVNVIEAQRNARDAVRSFVEALQASRIAHAAVRRAQLLGGPLQ